jgi:hypothetical protein
MEKSATSGKMDNHEVPRNQSAYQEEKTLTTGNLSYQPPGQIGPGGLQAMDSSRMSRADILVLQRVVGNRVVGNWLRNSTHRTVQREGEEMAPAQVSGSLPDKEVPPDPEFDKGLGQGKEDGSATPQQARSVVPEAGAGTGDYTIKLGNLGFEFNNPMEELNSGQLSHKDVVENSTIGTEWNNPGNKVVTPFGSESFVPSYKALTYTAKDPGKEGDPKQLSLNFTLSVSCPWGANGGSNIDVPSATDPIVSTTKLSNGKKTYEQIVEDLSPVLVEKSWRAPRSKYWSKAICERHEMFHSTDDKSWSEGPGKEFLANYLKGKTVSGSAIDAGLADHMTKGLKALGTANFNYYKGGASSYFSYAGEERAFGDGKVPYQELAAAVRAQGLKLDEAEAKTSSSSTPPVTPSPEVTPTPPGNESGAK